MPSEEMTPNQQKRALAPEIQELFQQQSEIEQEYRSLDAVGRYRKRLRTFSNLSDEFVRKVLVQRGYNTPPRKNQEPATSEEVNSAQATTSSARSTKVTGRRRDTTAPLAPTDPKWLADKAEHSLAECERLLEWVSKSIQDVSAEREKQLKVIAAAREHSARAWERYHRVVDTTLDETRRHQAREEMDAAECREGKESADISSPRFDVEYRKAVAREVAGSLRDTLLPGLDEMAARNDDPRLQQTIIECKEGVARATLYVINRFPTQGPLRDDKIWRARIEAQKLVNGTWVG